MKLAKAALKAIDPRSTPISDLGYNNLLIAAEELINRRPLEDEVLTPAHFLLGRAPGMAVMDLTSDASTTRSWQNIRQPQRELWTRLQKEVVPLLQKRHKWHKE